MSYKLSNLKFIIAIVYIFIILLCFYFLSTLIDLKDLSNYDFLRLNKDIIFKYKQENFFFVSIIFFIFSIFWILFLGLVTPLLLFSGFFFGKWWGTIIAVLGATIGATLLYILVKFFFHNLVKKYLDKKFYKLKQFFNKNDFFYYAILRLLGGIPFTIQNIIPILFNMSIKTYFFATLLGCMPQMFISVAIGSGIEQLLEKNDKIVFYKVLTSPEIFLPILAMVGFLIAISIIRKFLLK